MSVLVKDNETGKLFNFPSHKEKEKFFDMWDKYETTEEEDE